jgi:hypothetical protein
MKLNLLMASDDIRAGYRNLDCFPEVLNKNQSFSQEKEYCENIQNLDSVCEDGEAEEIIALDVIDYIDIRNKQNVMDHWIKKVAIDGRIVIGGIEIKEVARNIYLDRLDLEESINLLYGDPNFPFGNRKGCLSSEIISNLLQSRGLRIISKKLINYKYCIIAERTQ